MIRLDDYGLKLSITFFIGETARGQSENPVIKGWLFPEGHKC
jgi:hypothetical protein